LPPAGGRHWPRKGVAVECDLTRDLDEFAQVANQARLAMIATSANRAQYDSGEREKSELAKASEACLSHHSGINEQPTSGSQREWIREVVGRARDILKRHGIKISPADLLATWWYPEKKSYMLSSAPR
jgi:hypothetical protein